ncbi:major capsid protein [Altererythrobacter indicus]|uniref:Major capsid protein n=1 Tax=Altericroceibacterium indicum TaxID=374177 RepID=A0A845A5H9_9SPHN|nr:major capsid protein [Altericroceibacterium indicum]MXP24817.1 major capsid protein [Altericroceibacterium indicum]
MLTMDVFKQDAFSAISMTEAVRRSQTIPGLLGRMNLFTPKRVRSRRVAVEMKGQQLNIIQTSEPGAPRTRRSNDKASVVDLRVRRIEESSMVTAEEIQGIRAFGSETELKQLQSEIAERQQGCIDDLSATRERLYLSCIDGILRDADDSVIYDYYQTFGYTKPAEIDFDWANATKVKKFVANNVKRPMIRAIGGSAPPSMRIIALCGDDFYDDLQENSEYKDQYKNTANASKLVEDTVFDAIDAWGVTWINYRGTDDNSKVAVGVDKVKFFPMGVRGLFQEAFAPAPTFDHVNTLGQEWYSRMLLDDKRQEWADVEIESHRLPICTRPEVLLSGNK